MNDLLKPPNSRERPPWSYSEDRERSRSGADRRLDDPDGTKRDVDCPGELPRHVRCLHPPPVPGLTSPWQKVFAPIPVRSSALVANPSTGTGANPNSADRRPPNRALVEPSVMAASGQPLGLSYRSAPPRTGLGASRNSPSPDLPGKPFAQTRLVWPRCWERSRQREHLCRSFLPPNPSFEGPPRGNSRLRCKGAWLRRQCGKRHHLEPRTHAVGMLG